jgi:hypothetical protein
VWAKIGVLSFGGPAGKIALMHRILVDERKDRGGSLPRSPPSFSYRRRWSRFEPLSGPLAGDE